MGANSLVALNLHTVTPEDSGGSANNRNVVKENVRLLEQYAWAICTLVAFHDAKYY